MMRTMDRECCVNSQGESKCPSFFSFLTHVYLYICNTYLNLNYGWRIERRRHGIGKFATLKDDTDRLPPSRKASLPAALAFPDFDHPRSKVARATAAKAKLLLRELKTVKADIAFVKERRAQLEEENIHLRENHHGKGSNPAIRLQLESLLAEKARFSS
ncbi:BnaA03g00020D [Brassica napus]|uniref:BnaA03g00020D protein n=1 Tax=Brassica napus TaxID=3708 RepID=A0A078FCV0_BRANA|nr:BnaA03g00020D [Brassica napus]